jgi:hypothetical protein
MRAAAECVTLTVPSPLGEPLSIRRMYSEVHTATFVANETPGCQFPATSPDDAFQL